jgi:hypothetical protein
MRGLSVVDELAELGRSVAALRATDKAFFALFSPESRPEFALFVTKPS